MRIVTVFVRAKLVAACTATRPEAERIGQEVEALYTNGPAGGGGVRVQITEVLTIASILRHPDQ